MTAFFVCFCPRGECLFASGWGSVEIEDSPSESATEFKSVEYVVVSRDRGKRVKIRAKDFSDKCMLRTT